MPKLVRILRLENFITFDLMHISSPAIKCGLRAIAM
jgi:hypothetical protein